MALRCSCLRRRIGLLILERPYKSSHVLSGLREGRALQLEAFVDEVVGKK